MDAYNSRRDNGDATTGGATPSRGSVVRAGIEKKLASGERVTIFDGFGLLAEESIDAIEFQERMRAEW